MAQDSRVLSSAIKANATVFNSCVSLHFDLEYTKTNVKPHLDDKNVFYELLHNMKFDPT
jgi:hypothetical protein